VLQPLEFRLLEYFFFPSRRRHTSCLSDWSSDVCSSDLRESERRSSSPSRVGYGCPIRCSMGSGRRAGSTPSSAAASSCSEAPRRSEERRVGKECRAQGGACH